MDDDERRDEAHKRRFEAVAALAALNASAFLASAGGVVGGSLPFLLGDGDDDVLKRNFKPFRPRLAWDQFCRANQNDIDFIRLIRMKIPSFDKLLSYIRADLEVDLLQAGRRGGAIIPEICLFVTLRYVAGGSYLDLQFLAGISRPSFDHCVKKTLRALAKCEKIAIEFPQTIEECAKGSRLQCSKNADEHGDVRLCR